MGAFMVISVGYKGGMVCNLFADAVLVVERKAMNEGQEVRVDSKGKHRENRAENCQVKCMANRHLATA